MLQRSRHKLPRINYPPYHRFFGPACQDPMPRMEDHGERKGCTWYVNYVHRSRPRALLRPLLVILSCENQDELQNPQSVSRYSLRLVFYPVAVSSAIRTIGITDYSDLSLAKLWKMSFPGFASFIKILNVSSSTLARSTILSSSRMSKKLSPKLLTWQVEG